jgi:hypothetical protein
MEVFRIGWIISVVVIAITGSGNHRTINFAAKKQHIPEYSVCLHEPCDGLLGHVAPHSD